MNAPSDDGAIRRDGAIGCDSVKTSVPKAPPDKSPSSETHRRSRRSSGSIRLPRIGRHSSGQARLTIRGKVHYLGEFGSPEADQRYRDICRRLLAKDPELLFPARTVDQKVLTVKELIDDWWRMVESAGLYMKEGKPTSSRAGIRATLSQFNSFAGDLKLTTLRREHLIRWRTLLLERRDLTTAGINLKIATVRMVLQYGHDNGHVSDAGMHSLMLVKPLKRSAGGDRDQLTRARRALTHEEITAILPHVSPAVAGMIRFQLLTGCRPGEACKLRLCDVDRSPDGADAGDWVFNVPFAKTSHLGKSTSYVLNQECQQLILSFAKGPSNFVFTWRGRRIDPNGYATAVSRACKKAGIAHWSPHELRHTTLTAVYERHGLQAACEIANHSSPTITARYLHPTKKARFAVARELTVAGLAVSG